MSDKDRDTDDDFDEPAEGQGEGELDIYRRKQRDKRSRKQQNKPGRGNQTKENGTDDDFGDVEEFTFPIEDEGAEADSKLDVKKDPENEIDPDEILKDFETGWLPPRKVPPDEPEEQEETELGKYLQEKQDKRKDLWPPPSPKPSDEEISRGYAPYAPYATWLLIVTVLFGLYMLLGGIGALTSEDRFGNSTTDFGSAAISFAFTAGAVFVGNHLLDQRERYKALKHVVARKIVEEHRAPTSTGVTYYPTEKGEGFNIGNKGIWIDSWSDLLEGMAGKAEEVNKEILKQLQDKKLPNVRVREVSARTSIFSSARRPYILLETHPGATTGIYISARGEDLYVSWKTFVVGVFNRRLLMILLGFSAIPNICTFTIAFAFSAVDSITSLGGFGSLSAAIFPAVAGTIAVFIFLVGLIALAGFFIRGDFLSFLLIEPTLFAVEDITVLSHAADKAVRNSLKKVGIADALIRRKTDFKGNKRGSTV